MAKVTQDTARNVITRYKLSVEMVRELAGVFDQFGDAEMDFTEHVIEILENNELLRRSEFRKLRQLHAKYFPERHLDD